MTINLFSQTIELPPDSLIVKYHIKTIKSYFSSDSIPEELDCIWEFDSLGRIISSQLIDIEDTVLCMDLYFYEKSLLKEKWRIGEWPNYDTLKINYFYDQNKRIIKETYFGKFIRIDYEITYTYLNDLIILKQYTGVGNGGRSSGIDSLVYNSDKTIKYLFNSSQNLKITYEYNNQKQLIYVFESSISKPNSFFCSKTYIHEKEQLVKEIEWHDYSTFGDNKNCEFTYFYINNKAGLLTKIIRPFSMNTYKYDFYK